MQRVLFLERCLGTATPQDLDEVQVIRNPSDNYTYQAWKEGVYPGWCTQGQPGTLLLHVLISLRAVAPKERGVYLGWCAQGQPGTLLLHVLINLRKVSPVKGGMRVCKAVVRIAGTEASRRSIPMKGQHSCPWNIDVDRAMLKVILNAVTATVTVTNNASLAKVSPAAAAAAAGRCSHIAIAIAERSPAGVRQPAVRDFYAHKLRGIGIGARTRKSACKSISVRTDMGSFDTAWRADSKNISKKSIGPVCHRYQGL